MAALGSAMGLDGFRHQTLSPGPLPGFHEPSSHILWAEASAEVPVVSSPPPHRLWSEPQYGQSLPFWASWPQPSLGKEGRQEHSEGCLGLGLQIPRAEARRDEGLHGNDSSLT